MVSRPRIVVRPLEGDDLEWAEALLEADFGGRLQARRGQLVDALAFPGLVAADGRERIGLLTYDLTDEGVEVVLVEAVRRGAGVGTALIDELVRRLPDARIWLVTTNDNLDALRFYQRRGFRICAVRPGAVDEARRTLKPAIAAAGGYGIPIRDEIELERPPQRSMSNAAAAGSPA